MKRFWQVLVSTGIIISINGCSSFLNELHPKKMSSQEKVCQQLHSQIIFNDNLNASNSTGNSSGPNMVNSTPTQKARSMREYRRYNCDQLINN